MYITDILQRIPDFVQLFAQRMPEYAQLAVAAVINSAPNPVDFMHQFIQDPKAAILTTGIVLEGAIFYYGFPGATPIMTDPAVIKSINFFAKYHTKEAISTPVKVVRQSAKGIQDRLAA